MMKASRIPAFGAVLLVWVASSTVFAAATSGEKQERPAKAVYEQRPIGASPQLISPAAAAETINRFKTAYSAKLGSPRFLIYVNRELVDVRSGLKLAGRDETVVTTKRDASKDIPAAPEGEGDAAGGKDGTTSSGTETVTTKAGVSSNEKKVAHVNRYERVDREEDSFEYKQMVRDVELMFGRRLRSAGASLADQRTATQLLADRNLRDFTTPTEGEQAHKDRDALARIADVVVEVLIANKEVPVSKLSGNGASTVPDIQVTAIRIKDSKIIGQATSMDVLGQKAQLNYVSSAFTAREIADATALFFMEDMLLGIE